MQRSPAWAALAFVWASLSVAHAQEIYRVDVDVSARAVCAWTEQTREKMMDRAAMTPFPAATEGESRFVSISAFGRDGADLLVADVDPKQPNDTVFLRFGPGGMLLAAAFDQGSL